ncbi:LacI family DNA-binding transcriptional regulator [Fictibacillus terranigra]|uniref:LacI family DNA-binding transcriptional regulator n=1 Tax=Fictibacillus terranigra TaxID=3058424 RepID=A0ABT8EDT1_9BACL|nr:LacI family DNA-binding transcriptional regulator [Fictibacillus sp. CENA-BCM004]MDN4075967.1 LacI family DNA-binding transcriptional regulator [Fictibacillus sp. CENA-BCM004]
MSSNIKDVARHAAVSISTVSRVMNMPDKVAKETRDKVLNAIRELNYMPNALARGLIFKRTKSLGVLIPDISNMFYSEMLHGMEAAAHDQNYNLILCNTDNNKTRMMESLSVLKEKQIDGLIFTSEPIYPDYHELFLKLQIPIVLAATHSLEYDLPSVKVNDEQASYDATEYLIKNGHRQIGMICGSITDQVTAMPRLQGFLRALKVHQMEADMEKLVEFGSYKFEDGYHAMHKLLEKYPDITAVFAAGDERALGAISYLHEKGKSVPEDISVIGFDNLRLSQMSIPKLTTVGQPLYEIGYLAVEKLDHLIQKEHVPELRTYVDHQIVERQSVKMRNHESV